MSWKARSRSWRSSSVSSKPDGAALVPIRASRETQSWISSRTRKRFTSLKSPLAQPLSSKSAASANSRRRQCNAGVTRGVEVCILLR